MNKVNYKYSTGDIVYFIFEDKPYVGEVSSVTIYGTPSVVQYKIKIKKKEEGKSFYTTHYENVVEEYVFSTKEGLIQYLTESINSLDWYSY